MSGLSSFYALFCTLCLLSAPLAARAAEPLVLQIHPFLTAKQITDKFTPLADYLGKRLDRPVKVAVSKDYIEHVSLIGRDKVDIAYLGPAPYVEMVAQYGPKPLLTRMEVAGKPVFRGAIVVGKNSTAKRLEDLAGARFAFGSMQSTMSHLLPHFMLNQAGIGLEKLGAFTFLDSHDNVALGVLMGEFDAGALMEEVFLHYQARGLNVLAWTPDISEHLFVTRSDLPPDIIESLRQAMLELRDQEGGDLILKTIKNKLTGLVPVEDQHYANLRLILDNLKNNPVQP